MNRWGEHRRVASNIATLVCGLALALVTGEIGVRFIAPQPVLLQSPRTYVRDTAVGYRLNPGHVGFLGNRVEYMTTIRINTLGWRGPPPVDTSANRTRILFLGDSFVFGQGVEVDDAVPARLEAQLSDSSEPVEVLNAGVPGYGTVQAVKWLEAFGLHQDPDLVILGAFLGNDIKDNAQDPGTRWQIVGHAGDGDTRWFRPVTDWMYARSDLYRLLRAIPDVRRDRSEVGGQRRDVRAVLDRYGLLEGPQRHEALVATCQSLERLGVIGRTHDIQTAIVLIPEAPQVEPWREASLRGLIRGNPQIDMRWPNRQFDSLARLFDLPIFDLTDAFASAALAGDTLYFPVDGHWTPGGHQLAATALATWLQALGVRHRPTRGGSRPVLPGPESRSVTEVGTSPRSACGV